MKHLFVYTEAPLFVDITPKHAEVAVDETATFQCQANVQTNGILWQLNELPFSSYEHKQYSDNPDHENNWSGNSTLVELNQYNTECKIILIMLF